MKLGASRTPLSVYMLADHLDAALAAGEDIMARGIQWRELAARAEDPVEFAPRHRKLTEEIRGLELIIVARILKARTHAETLAEYDDRFSMVGRLFASGTAILLDAVEESGDARGVDFDTGDDIVAYIRSRGLIAPDAAAIQAPSDLTIDDSFRAAQLTALNRRSPARAICRLRHAGRANGGPPDGVGSRGSALPGNLRQIGRRLQPLCSGRRLRKILRNHRRHCSIGRRDTRLIGAKGVCKRGLHSLHGCQHFSADGREYRHGHGIERHGYHHASLRLVQRSKCPDRARHRRVVSVSLIRGVNNRRRRHDAHFEACDPGLGKTKLFGRRPRDVELTLPPIRPRVVHADNRGIAVLRIADE
jgi:hypothetical protein